MISTGHRKSYLEFDVGLEKLWKIGHSHEKLESSEIV